MVFHFPSPGVFPEPGIKSCIAGRFFTTEPLRKPFSYFQLFSGWGICINLLKFQFSSVARSRPTLCDTMNCNTPGLPVYHQLSEFTQTHVHRVGNALQPSHPRPLLLLPPIPPSIKVFSNESTLRMRWPKYWSFSFSIIPSKEIPGLIFRMDRLDLLAVQGTLKSLLQHHSL